MSLTPSSLSKLYHACVNISSASSNSQQVDSGIVPRVGVGVPLAALVAHMPTPNQTLVSRAFHGYLMFCRRLCAFSDFSADIETVAIVWERIEGLVLT